MSRKVIDVTRSADKYDILSQTPKNYDSQNYFIKELQDKVDAEWDYRPNRVDIEYETIWGHQKYEPMEAVVQTVKSDKGTAVSDDYKNLVFKNITEDRFVIGSRFRFAPLFHTIDDNIYGVELDKNFDDLTELEEVVINDDGSFLDDYVPLMIKTFNKNKNVWLVTNTNQAKITASVVVQRCNGSLAHLFRDEQGVAHCHYEPVIQGTDLSGTNMNYSETVVLPQSQLIVICQHNDWTRNYYINQRFIVGYDKVYRITAINKFYSNMTWDPEKVGLMKIYLELTESSPYDNFETRIAYNKTPEVIITTNENMARYSIKLLLPHHIPTALTSEPITFAPLLYDTDNGREFGAIVDCEYKLENLPDNLDPSIYIDFKRNDNGTFTFARKRLYLGGDLVIKFYVTAENSPSYEEVSISFTMLTRSLQ